MQKFAARTLSVLTLTFGLGASGVAGQIVVGDILDETRTPVASAMIGVFDEEGVLVAQGVSDSAGHFNVEVPGPGSHTLHVARLGYRSLSGGPYDLHRGIALELFVVLHRAPIEVEGIEVEVEGRSGRLAMRGFYERREAGFGYFFDRQEIERLATSTVSNLLVRIPGVEHAARPSLGPHAFGNQAVQFDRGTVGCVPALWIDGSLLRPGGPSADPLRPDDWFIPSEVEGIEFYGGPASVPMEFARSSTCAVLVVWTRGSGRERGRPG